jgi:hypothetical protein
MGFSPEMKSTAKRVLTIVVGWVFILLGIAGLFLPILQGILFILIGLIILSSEYVWAHHLLQKLRARFPRIAHMSDEAKIRAEAWMDRIIHRKRTAHGPQANAETSSSCEIAGCTAVPTVLIARDSRNTPKAH